MTPAKTPELVIFEGKFGGPSQEDIILGGINKSRRLGFWGSIGEVWIGRRRIHLKG